MFERMEEDADKERKERKMTILLVVNPNGFVYAEVRPLTPAEMARMREVEGFQREYPGGCILFNWDPSRAKEMFGLLPVPQGGSDSWWRLDRGILQEVFTNRPLPEVSIKEVPFLVSLI